MHKENILFVIDSMGVGGAEKVTLTLAQNFAKLGSHVDLIICDNIIDFIIPENINVHILDFKKSFMDYTRYAKKLHEMITTIRELNNSEFDLILVHLQKATRLMKYMQHPNIYHVVHSTFSQSAFKNRTRLGIYLKRKKLQKIYNGLNIVAVSDGIKDDLLKEVQIKPKSIQTIYNPVDKDILQEMSLETIDFYDENYIVHVGRLAKVKRHDVLLKAFAKAQLDTKLVLVGDGEERENIKNLIVELGLIKKVIMTGFIQNPYPIVKNAKLLVLSSEYEGLSIVLIESLMLNTPVICTNCKSGPSEILTGDYAKYLCGVNDIDDLSIRMKSVYNSPYKIDTMLTEKFSLALIVNQYMNL